MSESRAKAETDSGAHAFVAGNLERSKLVYRISTYDHDEVMPPEGKPLSDEEIANLVGQPSILPSSNNYPHL